MATEPTSTPVPAPNVAPTAPVTGVAPALAGSVKPATIVTPPTPALVRPPSIAAAVNAAQGKMLKPPPGLTVLNTNDLGKRWFHACIYGDTSVRKTSTIAKFTAPADIVLVLTRPKEQAIPLEGMGINVLAVTDADALRFAIQYPEQFFPEWAKRENRTFMLDDTTEAVAQLLEDAGTIDGKEVKDRRRSYTAAGEELRDLLTIAKSKPQHVLLTATAKVRENPISNEERIGPDLPPSMLSYVLTELEFVFYINPNNYTFTTDRDRFVFKDTGEDGKEKTFAREIFAKHKLPMSAIGKVPPVISKNEKMDLADIWKRVQSASVGGKK